MAQSSHCVPVALGPITIHFTHPPLVSVRYEGQKQAVGLSFGGQERAKTSRAQSHKTLIVCLHPDTSSKKQPPQASLMEVASGKAWLLIFSCSSRTFHKSFPRARADLFDLLPDRHSSRPRALPCLTTPLHLALFYSPATMTSRRRCKTTFRKASIHQGKPTRNSICSLAYASSVNLLIPLPNRSVAYLLLSSITCMSTRMP